MISACIIAKNEEDYLPRLLDSIREEIDQIVVVDTGSTSASALMYRRYQQELGEKFILGSWQWNNDFAAARNHAASLSTQPWQMWLDADMYFAPGEINKIKALIATLPDAIDGVGLKIIDAQFVLNSVRVLRQGCRFVGKVHENPDVKQSIQTPFTIYHDRVEPDRTVKDRLYEQLLTEELNENPDSIHALSYLRDLALNRKEWAKVNAYCRRIIGLKPDEYLSYYHLAVMEMESRNNGSSLDWAFKALQYGSLDPRVYLLIADLYDEAGKKVEAMAFYKHILNLNDEAKVLSTNYAIDEDNYHVIPYTNMAKIYLDIGNKQKAVECYRRAIESNPNTPHFSTIEKNIVITEGGIRNLPKTRYQAAPEICVIIPTMAKKPDYLTYTLRQLSANSLIGDIILICNHGEPIVFDGMSDKIRQLVQTENIGVNPAWNLGMTLCRSPYYLLLNDDVLCQSSIIDSCYNVLRSDNSVGQVVVETLQALPSPNAPITPVDMYIYYQLYRYRPYGWFMLGKSKDWRAIPETMKIFYGDNYIQHGLVQQGYNIAKLVSATISHDTSSTVRALQLNTALQMQQERYFYEQAVA